MTIKWVQQDPLVMNGEPFCYGSRLTVRQLLELRSNGYDLTRILKDHPELRAVGVAAAFTYAAAHRERYADFFEPDGSLAGPGLHRGTRRPACRRSTGCPASSSSPPGGRARPAERRRGRYERMRGPRTGSVVRSVARTPGDRHRMTDTTTLTVRRPRPTPRRPRRDAPAFDPERRATELAILDALRAVVDPEIGMNVVELALIKQILLGPDSTEIKMILTTPFCPYAGSMIAQVKEQAESVVEHDVKVTLLAERWDPRDAGLMW